LRSLVPSATKPKGQNEEQDIIVDTRAVDTRFVDPDGELIETPCVGVCTIDQTRDICSGCGRTVPEIAGWRQMSAAQRRTVMEELPDRLAKGRGRKGGRRARVASEGHEG
jgi:predicted Fe-S protein YdhL (DUF1289 family)